MINRRSMLRGGGAAAIGMLGIAAGESGITPASASADVHAVLGDPAGSPRPHLRQHYRQTNLVASSPAVGVAETTDPNLRSAWGMAQSADGPWWVTNQFSKLATVYSGRGTIQPTVVKIPIADPVKMWSGPTGIVFNPSQGFVLANGRPATFLICTMDGLIVGWNQDLAGNTAQIIFNRTGTSIYDGMAISPATVDGAAGCYLFVPDFKAFRVDVFDGNFQHARKIEKGINSFRTPAGYAPLNITAVGGNVYVTYAKPDPDPFFDGALPVIAGGNGLVASFSPEGKLNQVLQHGQFLNGPWGVTLAPGNFGLYSHHLLVGNNGDGKINVYNPVTGAFVDQLRDISDNPIAIRGLWGMFFGNNTEIGGSATSLFFASSAGDDYTGGLFGKLTPVQNEFGSGL